MGPVLRAEAKKGVVAFIDDAAAGHKMVRRSHTSDLCPSFSSMLEWGCKYMEQVTQVALLDQSPQPFAAVAKP